MTNAEMAEADRLAIAGDTPGFVLMEQSGAAVVAETTMLVPRDSRGAVYCGPGNYGGDGFVAAGVRARQDFNVEIALLGARGVSSRLASPPPSQSTPLPRKPNGARLPKSCGPRFQDSPP